MDLINVIMLIVIGVSVVIIALWAKLKQLERSLDWLDAEKMWCPESNNKKRSKKESKV